MAIDAAVVLAAGEGTRLRPLTRHRPKPMLPAGNRPILEHVFNALVDAGITDLHVVVGYKRDRVQGYFGSTYRDAEITYHIQEKQLGSGHALAQARDGIEESFLVVNGDQLVESGIVADVVEAHAAADAVGTLSVIRSQEASRYGSVRLADGMVTDLTERAGEEGATSLLNAGVYAFEPAVFPAIEETPRQDGSVSLPATITQLTESGANVRGVRTEGFWADATFPWDLPAVTQRLLRLGWVSEDETEPSVWIAEDATVHETATFQGPVVVSSGAEIGPGAVVGPHVAVGRDATVETDAVVHNSVVDDDVRIGIGAIVGDSVLGQSAALGPGSVLPGGTADIRVGERVYEDRRLGAVFADRVTAEGDVSCRPGVLVGPKATIRTGVTVSENVPEDAEVRR